MAACRERKPILSNKKATWRQTLNRTKRMTIKKRLFFSFAAINVLFCLNVGFFSWSNYRRKTTVEDHRNAITGEKIIAEVQQKLINVQKQVAILSETGAENSNGARAEDIAQFKTQLDSIHQAIDRLRSSSKGEVRTR